MRFTGHSLVTPSNMVDKPVCFRISAVGPYSMKPNSLLDGFSDTRLPFHSS